MEQVVFGVVQMLAPACHHLGVDDASRQQRVAPQRDRLAHGQTEELMPRRGDDDAQRPTASRYSWREEMLSPPLDAVGEIAAGRLKAGRLLAVRFAQDHESKVGSGASRRRMTLKNASGSLSSSQRWFQRIRFFFGCS